MLTNLSSPFGFGRDKKADLFGLGIYNKKSGEFSLISEDKENYPCFYPHFSDGENSLISFVDAIEAVEFQGCSILNKLLITV
ncbi:MAG: hypothetical protein L3J54_09090 [Draconibacterium sp.]|nr:hypothetical protein [Draconibacterium sp.]